MQALLIVHSYMCTGKIGKTVCLSQGEKETSERQRQNERHRNVVMANNTHGDLPSVPSAAAVDHAGVTVISLALHHSLSDAVLHLPCKKH